MLHITFWSYCFFISGDSFTCLARSGLPFSWFSFWWCMLSKVDQVQCKANFTNELSFCKASCLNLLWWMQWCQWYTWRNLQASGELWTSYNGITYNNCFLLTVTSYSFCIYSKAVKIFLLTSCASFSSINFWLDLSLMDNFVQDALRPDRSSSTHFGLPRVSPKAQL